MASSHAGGGVTGEPPSAADVAAMSAFLRKNIRLKGYTPSKWTDEHDATAAQFLTIPELRKLVAYMSAEGELVLLTPHSMFPAAPRSFTYFVKRVDRAHLAPDTLKASLQWGFINGGGVDSLLRTMDAVFLPALAAGGGWPEAVRKDVSGQAARFMASLVETSHQIRGKTVLYIPPDPLPTDLKAAAADKDLIQRLEATVIHWTRQIKEVVSNQDASASSAEAGGPLDEVAYYVSRCQDLSGITDQLNAPGLRGILAVLHEASSSYLGPFELLAQSIQRGSDEAADNLKFLSILKPSCEALSASTPPEIPALLPEILNRIRVIGAVSRFYCTPDRLTSLLRKISNEVVLRCAAAIEVQSAFDGDVAPVMVSLEEAVDCCAAWRAVYDETVAAVAAAPGKRGLLWTFDTSAIFAQVEAFVQRCRDLQEVCEAQQQFLRKTVPGSAAQAPLPVFGGSRSGEITRSLATIEETFAGHVSGLRDLAAEALDVKSAAWGSANTRFKAHVKDLETMLSNVIADAFAGVTSIPACLELLEAFSSLARRPAVQRAVDKKAADVFALFARQVAEIKAEFDAHSSAPPLGPSEPQYSGAALWARGLQVRAEGDWRLLTRAHYLSPSKAQAEAAESFEKLTAGLDEFMRSRYSEWMKTLGELDQTRLNERIGIPLFVRTTSMDPAAQAASVVRTGSKEAESARFLASNFDAKVLAMLAEVSGWERFEGKFLIPFYATDVARTHSDNLRVLRSHVLLVCSEYNTIVASFDEVEARLFADVVKRLDRKLAPGLQKMTWSTKGVKDFFLKDARKACNEVWTVVQSFKADRATLMRLIDTMRDTLLVDIEKNYVHDDGVFQDKQARHRGRCRHALTENHREMVDVLGRVYALFRADAIPVQKAWAKWIRSLDKRVEAALRGTVKSSLGEMQRAICGDPLNREAEVSPVFRLHLVLDGPAVEYRPSIMDLTETVNTVSHELLNVIRVVPRLEDVLPAEVKGYNATEEAIKAAIHKIASSGMGAAAALRALEKEAGKEEAEEKAAASATNETKEGKEGAADSGAAAAAGLAPLPTSSGPAFYDIISGDIPILQLLSDVMSGVKASTPSLLKHAEDFRKYSHLWDQDKSAFMKRYARTPRPLATVETDIQRFVTTESEIRSDIDVAENLFFIRVDHTLLKESLVDHCQQWQRHFTRYLNDNARKELDELHAKIAETARCLAEAPGDLDTLARNVRLVREMRRDKAAYEGRFGPLEAMYATLARFDVQADEAEVARLAALRPAWDEFQVTLAAGEELIKKAKLVMKKDTTDAVASFQAEVGGIKAEAREGLPYNDLPLADARERLNAWKARMQSMRDREKGLGPAMEVFEMPQPDYPPLADVEKDIADLELVWGIAEAWEADWASWKTGAFSSLDVAAMEEAAGKYKQKLVKNRHLNKWGCWQGMDARVKDFLATMPLIQALGNPAMRDRHWRSLMREVGIAFDPTSPDFTLEKVMEYGFPKFGDFIEELSSGANKEVAIETALVEINKVWKVMDIDLVEYKVVYWKIRSTEELFQTLEDQSVNVSTMKASPYYPSFAKELDYWEKTLSTISEIVDLQLNVQRQWMYLESIFMASEDIRKMLPAEAGLFDTVNATYAAITARILQNKNAVVACAHPGYLQELESMSTMLEQIQKALDQYLENKRQQFPRFYFLSNDDLLEILGQSKDPMQVQKHIKKCFEGIQTLKLIEPGAAGGNRTYEAHGMNAPDGEKVPFERKVIVDGAVEGWLIEVEKCMRWALQKEVAGCIPAAKGKDKLKWIKDFPGQLLITSGMVYFVLNCEKQLRSDAPLKNLKVTRKKQVLYLNKLAEIVRSPLDKVSRKKVVALITMELHTRDVMERMIKANCSSVDDFEWLSQLRLEFVKQYGSPQEFPYGTIVAKQTKSTLEFGFEYQGNNGRLVVTPLTDRCVLTLTTALYMQRGGAPAGPAGTGKTETVKDLGKNLAKFVVVFNCSDGLDFLSMGRMFSGLVQSGGWGCFPTEDHEILTNRGFMTYEELRAAWGGDPSAAPADPGLLAAGFDPVTQQMVYERPVRMVINEHKEQTLVDFTQADYASRWAVDNAFGIPDDVQSAAARSNHVSVLTTPNHDMYVRPGRLQPDGQAVFADPAPSAFEKMHASALVKGGDGPQVFKFLARARGGVAFPGDDLPAPTEGAGLAAVEDGAEVDAGTAVGGKRRMPSADVSAPLPPVPFLDALHLDSELRVNAFLELFGYWLGDGFMWVRPGQPPLVAFDVVKPHDAEWLTAALAVLGLEWECSEVEGSSGDAIAADESAGHNAVVHRVVLKDEAWTAFFFAAAVADAESSSPAALGPVASGSGCQAPALDVSECGAGSGAAAFSPRAPLGGEGVTSAKSLPQWTFQLPRTCARRILDGVRRADSLQGADSPGNHIFTSSARFRDQLVRLMLHAGFAPFFVPVHLPGDVCGTAAGGEPLVAKATGWKLCYPEDPQQSEPLLFASEDVREVAYTGRTWCLRMPSGFVVVRRAHREKVSGFSTSASRPLILGNCFDEFNRIEVEVLSVVAQQVLAIMEAIKARKTEFLFMDIVVRCNWQCGLFITMNPGYAGRSELPDNLKSLFRPVAMMTPDLALIAEVMLQSEGFQNSRPLAKKTITLYSLMIQQLSKQDHYDYGLRSLRGVLVCAGSLKRSTDLPEDFIVLRAIRDMNLPKFIKADAELFRLLLGDLFPSLELPPFEAGDLGKQIEQELLKAGLQLNPVILQKCIELRDSKATRHCNMLVGKTLAGKSTTWKMLSAATTALANNKVEGYQRVRIEPINPKSISMNELYGAYDLQTMEWTDGILSSVFRMFARDEKPDEKWLLLDGPVDTLWIESMNTVMDDNKTLTLINGDRIGMTEGMSLLFEVQDLSVASPATTSRAGMIYIDVADLGWGPFVTSWVQRMFKSSEPGKDSPTDADLHAALFKKYVPRLLRFRRKECKELVPTGEFNSVIALCNILEALYAVPENKLGRAFVGEPAYAAYVERWFAFACVWTLGGAVDEAGRKKFNEALREVEPLFPPTGSVYDYFVEPGARDYKAWSDRLSAAWRPARDMPFSRIMVPTVDTLRNLYVVHTLVNKGMHVMVVGNTGTGKTVLAQQELEALSADVYGKLTLYFSAATSSNTVQDIIESVLEKRSKNKMGPIGGKKLVLLVDDLNMPKKDTFGSQPPLELLRQWVDYGGWYDRAKQSWRFILDMQLLVAMGPPGGGRSVISERLQSRFNIVNFTFPSDKTVKSIFEAILAPRMADYAEDVKKLVPNVVAATVAVYEKVVEVFLPTPANCHYLFNLRDIAKVVQGCLSANRRDYETKEAFLRLWGHECMRTFADRFTTADDIAKFRGVLDASLHKNCEVYYKQLMDGQENPEAGPVYVDFMGGSPAVPGDSTEALAPYGELAKLDRLRAVVEEEMVEYNSTPGLIPMNLVFFRDALRHVARIHRILRTPRGNALLVGVGGSGRQSLARVAAFLTRDLDSNRMGVFSIEISKQYRLVEFHEDLKRLYARTGVEGKPTMFLFSDVQIKEEAFLEDINNILNSGEVPNLYTKDERSAVIDSMRPIAKKLGLSQMAEDCWTLFIERVRSNLHVVLAMSPVGAAFRNRTRMYPSLVNCTTIDWFHNWPDDALREVATKFLDDVRLTSAKAEANGPDPDAGLKSKVATVFAAAHQSVINASAKMLVQMKRYNYVTPTNYLELVLGYREVVAEKRRELGDARDKLANGLAKLEDSKKQVEEMQVDLAAKQKIVEKSTAECEVLLVTIVQEKRIADEQKAEVEESSARISVEAAKCNAIAADAEADLAEAMPALEKAMLEVDKLDNSSISEVKAYTKPPDAVAMVLGGVMTLMGVPTDWANAKKKISESDFLRQIKGFDKDNVSQGTIKKLKKYTEIPGFEPDIIRKSSGAAAALCVWCLAIELYCTVAKEVEPKRQALKAAETLLAEKQAALSAAKEQLAAVIAKVDALNAQHTKSVQEKTALAMEAAALLDKLQRAESLIGGLSGERSRWEASIARFEGQLASVPGDALVAAAFMSYAGPFDTIYRENLVTGWLARVKENGVHFSDDFNFATFLADPSDVRDWNIQGLPSDQFSTENGVVVTRGRRWPLMVDPQGQANKWIKEMEKKRGLKVTDLKAKDFLRELEQAITYGLPYLLQDVEEELDPALEPVLTKSIVKRGTREVLKLGDKELDYNRSFRLYITTKLPNPHYTPEVSTKAAIVNFAVKEQGLEAQLLGVVVRMEEPRLEQQKGELVQTVATGKRKLAELESTILRLLSEVKGSLLDDVELIKTLQDSKTTSEEVSSALKIAEETEVKIDAAREGYRPVATRASLLYFVLNDLASVDPMYQFSLDAYQLLFKGSIADSKAFALKNKSVAQIFDEGGAESGPDRELKKRINDINEWHTYEVYKYTCRGLFERHKLLLSFQICVRRQLVEQPGKISAPVYDFFLKGGNVIDRSDQKPNPCSEWLSANSWDSITELDKLDAFNGFAGSFEAAGREWNAWYFSATPEREPIPGDWESKCDDLMKLTVVRAVRPDRVLPAAAKYVAANLGPKFVEPPPFDLKAIFDSSSAITPLVFVLSPGVDPTAQVLILANALNINLEYCSLGQGQAPIATRMMQDAIKNGGWVFLQNCHLSISWMPTLEKLIDGYCAAAGQAAAAGGGGASVPGAPHKSFRLWLSSSPHPKFPIAILQRGIKLTTEPPRGLKANLVRLYNLMNEDEFNARCEAAEGTYAKLVFSLCWFHAILLERRKFKALGFNIPYDFNDSDFAICKDILADYLATYKDKTPWDAIRYLIAEVNYGGRVTDDFDRRLTNTYVAQFFCEEAVKDSALTGGVGYKLSSLPDYYIPDDGEINDYKTYIATLPLSDAPQCFGQHANADIQSAIQDTTDMLDTILSLQPRNVAEGAMKPDDRVMAVAVDLEKNIPDPFDIEVVMTSVGPRADPEPLKVVLYQECERYNKLLGTMKRTLGALQKGIAGTVVITAELEAIFDALLVGRVPQAWGFCYPSLKPLGLWVRDLLARVEQLSNWVTKDFPRVFWLSGFTYPTGFLTAVLQTSARKNGLAIDTLEFEFPILLETADKIKEGPKEGAYIQGLFLEGAKWNFEEGYLADPEPMQLFAEMPVIHFKPVEQRKGAQKGVYRSPMYLYPVRTGTRERPSFMGIVELKSGLVEPEYWVKRGTALLLALAQ